MTEANLKELIAANRRILELEAENSELQYRLRHKTSEVLDVLRERNAFDAEIAKLRSRLSKACELLLKIAEGGEP